MKFGFRCLEVEVSALLATPLKENITTIVDRNQIVAMALLDALIFVQTNTSFKIFPVNFIRILIKHHGTH